MNLMNPHQVAEILGISDRTVHQLCREGKLSYCQVDAKHRRFVREHIDEYLRSVSVQSKVSYHNDPSSPSSAFERPKKPAKDEEMDLASLREEMDKW